MKHLAMNLNPPIIFSAFLSVGVLLSGFTGKVFADPLPNTIRISEPAGRGTRAMDYAPDGTLGVILTESNRDGVPASTSEGVFEQLVFRERQPDGSLGPGEFILGPTPAPGEGGSTLFIDAALFYDSSGEPHVYLLKDYDIEYYARDNGEWMLEDTFRPPGIDSSFGQVLASIGEMSAAKGSDGSIHFVLQSYYPDFRYVKHDSAGNWTWETITDQVNEFNYWGPLQFVEYDHTRPRNLSIAVDVNGHAHVAFSYDQTKTPVSGYTAIRSSLFYATNETGSWAIETLLSPGAGYGDYGGLACSIAAAADGAVAIAALVIPRPVTGSPGVSWLAYLSRNPNKTWKTENVAGSSAGYLGGDGDRGTGMNPLVIFDNQSKPHIVFTDIATTHYPYQGAFTYSGQVRYATRSSATSGSWDVRRVISGNGASPEKFHTFEPAVAAYDDEFVVSAVTYLWSDTAGRYIPTFHFLENPPDIPYIAPPMEDVVRKAKTSRKIKKLKAKIKKAKKAGNVPKLKKLKKQLKKLKKLLRSL